MATYKELREQRKELGHTEYHKMIRDYSDKARKLEAAAHEVLLDGLCQVWKQKKDKSGVAVVTEKEIIALSNGIIPKRIIPAYCGNNCHGKIFATKTFALRIRQYDRNRKIICRYIEIDENGNQIGNVIEKEREVSLYVIEEA